MTVSAHAVTVLAVTVTAQQPLALGSTSEVSFFTESHSFVPGSVLRGALAATWIAENGPPTGGTPSAGRFRRLFDGDIRFGPLYPAGSQRTPLSVLRCKYPRSDACRATVVDLAFEDETTCLGCGQRLEASKGQLCLPALSKPRRYVRTSIDKDTMRAKDGELYGHAALPAGTTLTGTVFGRDDWLEQPRTLHLGGRRSVGGAADYAVTPASRPVPPPAGSMLVVRLLSPGVFVDVAGCPRLGPDSTLDLPDGVCLDRSWVRPVTWSGWHAAARLPKPSEVCAMPGTTYRFTGDPHQLADFAQRLLAEGAGLRRTEGFGVVEIAAQPWRPESQPPATTGSAMVRSDAHRRLQILIEGDLRQRERDWLVGALRGLQIEQHRGTGRFSLTDTVLDDLMAQPTAAGLTGWQREAIYEALANVDPATLRDLTTLVINLASGE